MTKIALRTYNHEIESMIEHGQRLDEAVAHCRHILGSYPKHLETYRLLGKAYLEAKRHDQAVDIFQRVLVCAPEDFVSHVGMSIIADDQGRLDEAIWHMERAFEVQPSNAAIQAELQRLFGRRDGMEPPKIRLTRGALAHMYVQGELYTQAISEIRAVMASDAQRMDMQVLLARAYFHNGQKAEAAEVCSELLSVSPYCLDANRLMAEILPGTQAAEAAQEYRRRVLELDPYAEFARGSMFAPDSVADAAVTLQRLEYTGEAAAGGTGVSLSLTAGKRVPEALEPAPSWLAAGRDVGATTEPVQHDQDLPEFLRGSGWREVPADSAESGDLETVSAAEQESAVDVEPGDLPDWVKALAPTDDAAPAAPAPAQEQSANDWHASGALSPQSQVGADSGRVEDTPDWLRDLAKEAEPAPDAPASPSEETPLAPTERSMQAAATSTEDDQGLAWLEGLAEKHGANPEELITPPEERKENPPDWIERLRQDQAAAPDGWAPTDPQPRVPGASITGPAQGPTPKAGSSMDWLSGLADSDAFAEMEKPIEGNMAQPASDASPPSPQGGAPAVDFPNWLEDKPIEPATDSPALSRERSAESEANVALPHWLSDLDGSKEVPAAEPEAAATQVPNWLQEPPEHPGSVGDDLMWRPITTEALPADISTPPFAQPEATEPEVATITRTAETGRQATPPRTLPAAQPAISESPSLGAAKTEMSRGNIAAALDVYGRLIRKGKTLPEIIRELKDALYRYPVEVPIWQALGDAYMRANRLQEALDAYTKAEELLR